MKKKYFAILLTCVLALSSVMNLIAPMEAEASTYTTTATYDMRKKTVSYAGIMSVSGDMSRKVTRAEFARMLVRASAYRSVLTKSSNVSVFTDVTQGNEYASAIRLAAENGWMVGYLGGNFRPDQNVTLNEAAKGVLYLLGYSATDFSGDEYNKRMSKYAFLGLNNNINYTDPATEITMDDCMNLFYNLMCCDKKDTSTAYVTIFGGTLSSDGEVNVLSMLDNSVKGPKVITSKTQLADLIPFGLDEGDLFLNGTAVEQSTLEAAASTYLVIYYSTESKTVWAYNTDSTGDKRIAKGKIASIHYSSTSTISPSEVILEIDEDSSDSDSSGDAYEGFTVSASDIQYAFSSFGTLAVGDYVTLIYQASSTSSSSSSSGETADSAPVVGTVIDYVD